MEEKKVENKTNGLSIAGFVVSCCSMPVSYTHLRAHET